MLDPGTPLVASPSGLLPHLFASVDAVLLCFRGVTRLHGLGDWVSWSGQKSTLPPLMLLSASVIYASNNLKQANRKDLAMGVPGPES